MEGKRYLHRLPIESCIHQKGLWISYQVIPRTATVLKIAWMGWCIFPSLSILCNPSVFDDFSSSSFRDNLAHAAAWLAKATTNNNAKRNTFVNEAARFLDNGYIWGASWDESRAWVNVSTRTHREEDVKIPKVAHPEISNIIENHLLYLCYTHVSDQ